MRNKTNQVSLLLDSTRGAVASFQELIDQALALPERRQQLELSLQELLREHNDLADTPEIGEIRSQIAKLNKLESSFFTGVRQAKKVVEQFKQEHHDKRGQAELVPKIRNGQSEEEGFFFPRR
ncbi:hypothetical protein KBI23_00065 [bacterium]|nr:hypothetical protein [bacterium]